MWNQNQYLITEIETGKRDDDILKSKCKPIK